MKYKVESWTGKTIGIDVRCRGCDFCDCGDENDVLKIMARARYHAAKTGHTVQFTRERLGIIRQV